MDEALLDAATVLIRRQGPDELNISGVAREAGVTTGAVYARYENANELLFALWKQRCATKVRQLIELAAQAGKGHPEAVRDLQEALSVLDQELAVSVAIVIAAPRVEELAESALPELRSWFTAARADGRIPNKAMIPIGFALGAVCFDAAIDPPARDWVTPIQLLPALASLSTRDAGIDSDATAAVSYTMESGDTTKDALLAGAVSVIARSGLRRSSTSRMARAAGLTQTNFFSVWKTRRDAVHDVVIYALRGLSFAFSPFGAAFLEGDATTAAEGLRRLLAPASHEQRRIRLELVLGSMYDPDIAALVRESDETSVSELTGTERTLVEALRAVNLGLILLEECVGGLDAVDFDPFVQALLAFIAGTQNHR